MTNLSELVRICKECDKTVSFMDFFHNLPSYSTYKDSYSLDQLKKILSFFQDPSTIILCPTCDQLNSNDLFIAQYPITHALDCNP